MTKSMMNTSRKEVAIYAYPVLLSFEDHQAIFVTLEEPNIFTEPYDSIWIKMAATLVYLVGLWASCILYSFVFYEATGRAASFRTVINQLVSHSYLSVSHFEFYASEMSKAAIFFTIRILFSWLFFNRLVED